MQSRTSGKNRVYSMNCVILSVSKFCRSVGLGYTPVCKLTISVRCVRCSVHKLSLSVREFCVCFANGSFSVRQVSPSVRQSRRQFAKVPSQFGSFVSQFAKGGVPLRSDTLPLHNGDGEIHNASNQIDLIRLSDEWKQLTEHKKREVMSFSFLV